MLAALWFYMDFVPKHVTLIWDAVHSWQINWSSRVMQFHTVRMELERYDILKMSRFLKTGSRVQWK